MAGLFPVQSLTASHDFGMARTLTDDDITAVAQRVAGLLQTAKPSKDLRSVYSAEQFAVEILGGHHTAKWVQRQCRERRIRVVGRRPYLIPQSEAVRFINPGARWDSK